jgi:hypothetical protein
LSTAINKLPMTVRFMNKVGAGAATFGWDMAPLDANSFLDKAVQETGLSDFGGDEFREPLGVLINSLEKEAQLTLLGRMAARADIQRVLAYRLKLVDLCKRHPEIEQGAVTQPIMVIGPPRTGTTIFHDLLAMDPDNRVPLTWECAHPLPPPETATYLTDPRIAAQDKELAQVDKLVPAFKSMHPMGAQRAQECTVITSYAFASMMYNTEFNVPSYEDWVMEADMNAALAFHHKFLQVLQWKAPGVRWALKTPQHLWHFDQVLRQYPDALVVQTHRDPARILVSISSLVAMLRTMCSDHVDISEIARNYARGLALGYKKAMDFRRSGQLPPGQVYDLYFKDFMSDQVGAVRSAYEHFGLELSDHAASAIQGFIDDHPHDKHGKHSYSLADVGMEETELREMFRDYREFFQIPEESIQ